MSCVSLTKKVQASCLAVKKVGGLDKRVYLGSTGDLAGVTFDADTNAITAITFKAATGLTDWIGRRDKNNSGSELEVGENVNLRNHSVNLSIYWETAADLAALDELLDQESVFAIVESVAGQLEVFGINRTNWDSFGLKPSANTGTSGTVLNDSTAFALTLTGGHTNLQMLYNPGTALATNIAALDALVYEEA